MRPAPWHPPAALSPAEEAVYARIKYAKLFVFLRDHRLTIFSADFQAEFDVLYLDSARGQPPSPPAQLALLPAQQGRALAAVAAEADARLVAGSSLKATLDCNWDDPAQREQAVRQILHTVERVDAYMAAHAPSDPAVAAPLAAAAQVRA